MQAEPLKQHETTHTVIQDQQTQKLISVFTTSKKTDEQRNFTPVKVSSQNFMQEDKDQNFSPFLNPRYIENKHLTEHEAATELLKKQQVSEAMQAAMDKFKINDRPCVKLIHKSEMFNEDGSPWEILNNKSNVNSMTTSTVKPKLKKEKSPKIKRKEKKKRQKIK